MMHTFLLSSQHNAFFREKRVCFVLGVQKHDHDHNKIRSSAPETNTQQEKEQNILAVALESIKERDNLLDETEKSLIESIHKAEYKLARLDTNITDASKLKSDLDNKLNSKDIGAFMTVLFKRVERENKDPGRKFTIEKSNPHEFHGYIIGENNERSTIYFSRNPDGKIKMHASGEKQATATGQKKYTLWQRLSGKPRADHWEKNYASHPAVKALIEKYESRSINTLKWEPSLSRFVGDKFNSLSYDRSTAQSNATWATMEMNKIIQSIKKGQNTTIPAKPVVQKGTVVDSSGNPVKSGNDTPIKSGSSESSSKAKQTATLSPDRQAIKNEHTALLTQYKKEYALLKDPAARKARRAKFKADEASIIAKAQALNGKKPAPVPAATASTPIKKTAPAQSTPKPVSKKMKQYSAPKGALVLSAASTNRADIIAKLNTAKKITPDMVKTAFKDITRLKLSEGDQKNIILHILNNAPGKETPDALSQYVLAIESSIDDFPEGKKETGVMKSVVETITEYKNKKQSDHEKIQALKSAINKPTQ